jgi:hypothetical protein
LVGDLDILFNDILRKWFICLVYAHSHISLLPTLVNVHVRVSSIRLKLILLPS